MTRLLTPFIVTLAACTPSADDLVSWPDAAHAVADAFCRRCAPDDATCPDRAFDSWTTDDTGAYVGDDLPDVPAALVEECAADLDGLATCDGYDLPDSCRELAALAGGGQ